MCEHFHKYGLNQVLFAGSPRTVRAHKLKHERIQMVQQEPGSLFISLARALQASRHIESGFHHIRPSRDGGFYGEMTISAHAGLRMFSGKRTR
jgi:hypothetical protein